MRQQHIQMTLVHRHVTWLAGDKPAVMKGWQHIGQTDKVVE